MLSWHQYACLVHPRKYMLDRGHADQQQLLYHHLADPAGEYHQLAAPSSYRDALRAEEHRRYAPPNDIQRASVACAFPLQSRFSLISSLSDEPLADVLILLDITTF